MTRWSTGRLMWERKGYLWHFPCSSLHLPNSCFQYANNLGKQNDTLEILVPQLGKDLQEEKGCL